MDISETLAPKSDQLDAVDLLGGERTFTVESVSRHNAEQPINVHLAEFPRPWRPGVTMRRVLAACWGSDASQWTGRRVTLYCDSEVIFGADKVGGTRIRALSHIDGPRSVPIIVKKGRSGSYKVQQLVERSTPQQQPAAPQQQSGPNLTALFEEARIGPPQRLEYASNVLGRAIADPRELTTDDIAKVAEALTTKADEQGFDPETDLFRGVGQ